MGRAERSVISLFSGALGLDLGLERAGFRIRVAVESNRGAAATIRRNRPDIPVIQRRIEDVSTEEILDAAGLRPGQAAIVSGGPSCQSFSTAGKRGSMGDPRGVAALQFLRVVREARPRFFVMENVRGILSAALRHRPLRDRGPGHPPLEPDEELGSTLVFLLQQLRATAYFTVFDLLNAAEYGVPQVRERVVFIGSRDGEPVRTPARTHGDADGLASWVTLRQALQGLDDPEPVYSHLLPGKRHLMELVPEGGNWRDLPAHLQAEALGGAFVSWGGRGGFFRRLAWDRPTPALTTRPDSKATMLCHPTEHRPLSIGEYARVQQFDDGWAFEGSRAQQYTQVGNAVPLGLGEAVGWALRAAMRRRGPREEPGIASPNEGLVRRLSARSRTVLNPPRMRGDGGGLSAARAWMQGASPRRAELADLVTVLKDRPRPAGPRRVAEPPVGQGTVTGRREVAREATALLRAAYGSPRHGNRDDPLDELVFIVLSQMTTHHSYERVFARLHQAAPTWDDLLALPAGRLEELIADAGLSRQKAPRIRAILERVRADFGTPSLDPLRTMSDEDAERYLTGLPGVGVKTAKCVLMYSLGREVLPVDTHVGRVAARLGLVDPAVPAGRLHAALEAVVGPQDRYAFHVNAIAHGRVACRAVNPRCASCCLRRLCPSSPVGTRGAAADGVPQRA